MKTHLESIQPQSTNPLMEGGVTLYCNGLGDLERVEPTTSELSDLLEHNGGIRGNNILIQLRVLFEDFPNGPWYVDCINGIIYIHNSKFEDTPVQSYTFKQENGEVLSVNISLQNKHIPKDKKINVLDQFKNTSGELKATTNAFFGKDTSDPYKYVRKPESTNIPSITELSYDRLKRVEGAKDLMVRNMAASAARAEAKQRANENISKKLRGSLETRSQINLNEFLSADFTPEEQKHILNEAREGGNIFAEENGIGYIMITMDPEHTTRNFDQAVWRGGIMKGENRKDIPWNKRYASAPDVQVDVNLIKVGGRAKSELIQNNAYKLSDVREWEGPSYFPGKELNMQGIPSITESDALPTSDPMVSIKADAKLSPVFVLKKSDFIRATANWDPTAKRIDQLEQTNKRLAKMLENMAKNKKEKELTCNMVVVGKPSLTCFQNINVYNISKTYSGVWYIKTVTHSLTPQGGYTTTLSMTFRRKKSQ